MNKRLKKFLFLNQTLISTFILILLTIFMVYYVYVKLYRLTSKNSWENLSNAAESVNSQFTSNLQYQTLFLHDYADIFTKNRLNTREKIESFMEHYVFSSSVYEISVILPDSLILSSDGTVFDASKYQIFQREAYLGEHFSGIEKNFLNPDNYVLRHYYPVEVDGKVSLILYCTIDLDFLSSEGICEIYNGQAYYLLFNPHTKDIYVNTYTKGFGSVKEYMNILSESKVENEQLIERVENHEVAMAFVDSALAREKLFVYSIPTSYENFSVCIFTSAKVVFEDLYKFRQIACIIILILILCYTLYVLLMFKFTRERIAQTVMEDRVNKAESAAKAKSVFLSSMSHDIRTPMNAIIGYINLALLNVTNSVKSKHYLSKSIIACNHLLNLINEVLDMSRIESGKIQIKNEVCNLDTFVAEIENILHVQAKTKNLNFSTEKNIVHSYICCDRLHLSQILINILSNAVKYTNEGGFVKFTISELPSDQSKQNDIRTYEFRVKDNGRGMSHEFLKHVFQPFEREVLPGQNISGTGLGLSISKKLIEFMGGKIQLKSVEDIGTDVIIRLDLKTVSEDVYNKELKVELKEPTEENFDKQKEFFAGKALLLAEDNEFNREIAIDILENAGFKVTEARNGQEAVEKLAQSTPGYYSAVLMDIQMPVMNGYEATRMIRALQNKELAKIPVIALSANAFEDDLEKAKKEHIDAYVVKPISIDKLFKVLKQIL